MSSRLALSMVAYSFDSSEVIIINNVYVPIDFVEKEEL